MKKVELNRKLDLKVVIVLISVLLSAGSVYSQTWERAFGFVYGKEEGAYTICKLADGSFIAGGYAEETGLKPARIIKINSFGDTLWSKRIIVPNSNSTTIHSSLALDDGGFLISGYCEFNQYGIKSVISSSFVAKYNSDGNVIWIKCYYSYEVKYAIINIIKANDGGYLCSSVDNILKINDSGDYLWLKPSSYYGYSSIHIFKAYDTNSYICGVWNYPYSGTAYLKINNSGERIWSMPINQMSPEHIITLPNKFFVMGSGKDTITNALILRIQTYDTLGNIILEKSINVHREEITDGFYLPINPNRILICSHSLYLTQDTFYCAIRLVDTNLNVIRSLDLTTKGGFRGLYSAVKQDEKYFLASGNISLHLGYGYEDFYVIKSDTNLNLQVSIGIKKITDVVPEEFSLKQNYPNPFNGVTQVVFGIKKKGNYSLKIFDVTGKMVEEVFSRDFEPGEYRTVINAERLSSGVYFYRLESGELVLTKKFVLVK